MQIHQLQFSPSSLVLSAISITVELQKKPFPFHAVYYRQVLLVLWSLVGGEGAVRATMGDHVHGHMLHGMRIRTSNVLLVGVLLLTGFGAAMIGMMALYRLKETQVVKENEILSLHLLLQGEREHGKEAERRNEGLKQETYKLRDRNTELEGRISEMQDAITALREELGNIESVLQEKRNDLELLRQRYAQLQNENSQFKVLQEQLRAKEAEIDELKKQIPVPGKVMAEDDSGVGTSNATNSEKEQLEDQENPERRSVENVRDTDDVKSFLSDMGLVGGEVNMGLQESSRTGNRGKHKRLRGKRWRAMVKRVREMSNSRRNGVSITSDPGLAEARVATEDGTQHELENSSNLERTQNESVSVNQQLGDMAQQEGVASANSTSGDSEISFDEEKKDATTTTLPDDGTLKPSDHEVFLRQNTDNGNNLSLEKLSNAEITRDESTSTNQQPGIDNSPMDAGRGNATANNENTNQKVATDEISQQEVVAMTNSSSGNSQVPFGGEKKDATTSVVETALPGDATLKPLDHEVLLRQTTETKNNSEQGNTLGETKISHMNEHPGNGEVENHAVTELGSNRNKYSPYIVEETQEDDTEELDEPEF